MAKVELEEWEYSELLGIKKNYESGRAENRFITTLVCIGIIVVFALIALFLWGCPQ